MEEKSIAMEMLQELKAQNVRLEKAFKGVLTLCIILIVAFVGSNIAWLIYESQLEIGTQKDNVRDLIERHPEKHRKAVEASIEKNKGSNNPFSKLTENEIKEIYKSKLGYKKLSKIYKVSPTSIYFIKKKKTWKWLTDTLD